LTLFDQMNRLTVQQGSNRTFAHRFMDETAGPEKRRWRARAPRPAGQAPERPRRLICLEEGNWYGARFRRREKGVAGLGRGDRIGAAKPAGAAQGSVLGRGIAGRGVSPQAGGRRLAHPGGLLHRGQAIKPRNQRPANHQAQRVSGGGADAKSEPPFFPKGGLAFAMFDAADSAARQQLEITGRGLIMEETGFAARESDVFLIFVTYCKSTTYKMSFLIANRKRRVFSVISAFSCQVRLLHLRQSASICGQPHTASGATRKTRWNRRCTERDFAR